MSNEASLEAGIVQNENNGHTLAQNLTQVEVAEESQVQEINTLKPEEKEQSQDQSASIKGELEVEGKRLRRELNYLQKHTPDIQTTRKGEFRGNEAQKKQKITKESFKNYVKNVEKQREQSLTQMKWNLDSMKLPQNIEDLQPNKARLYQQMRGIEQDLSCYMKAKLLNVKEDLLASTVKVKRMLRILCTTQGSLQTENASDQWKLRLEGQIIDTKTQQKDPQKTCFLELFERIKIEFFVQNSEDPSQFSQAYLPIEWIKALSRQGPEFDCIQVVREWPKNQFQDIQVKISMWLENSPRKFVVGDQLYNVLGMREETRSRIITALWQYIKSNRLQDEEERQQVNLNGELQQIFPGHDKLEFHQLVTLLQPHLKEAQPLVLDFKMSQKESDPTTQQFNLPVTVHSRAHDERLQFLVDHNYSFDPKDRFDLDQDSKLDSDKVKNGNESSIRASSELKRREAKYDQKIGAAIQKMKQSYSQMMFYDQLAASPRNKIQNTIMEQNRLLRILQEEPVALSHNTRAYQTSVEPKPQHQQEQGPSQCRTETNNRVFFEKNAFWVTKEVEKYLDQSRSEMQRKEEEKKMQEFSENDQDNQSEGQEDKDLEDEQMDDKLSKEESYIEGSDEGEFKDELN